MQRRIGDLRRQGLALLITSCGLLIGKGALAAPAKPAQAPGPRPSSHPVRNGQPVHKSHPGARSTASHLRPGPGPRQRESWQKIVASLETQAAKLPRAGRLAGLLGPSRVSGAHKGHGGAAPSLAAAQAPGVLTPVNPTLQAFGSTDGQPVEPLHRVTFGDFDGDGDLDLFVSSYYYDGETETEHVYLRYGENVGTTTHPLFVERTGAANPMNGVDLASGNPGLLQLTTPAAGDVDGDGDVDLVVGLADGKIRYFLNTDVENGAPTGNGTLVEQTGDPSTAGDEPDNPFGDITVIFNAAPTLADIDGDGDLDVSVGSYYGGVSTFFQDDNSSPPTFTNVTNTPDDPFPAGAFAPSPYAPWQNTAPAFVDIDGDGDLDAFVGANYAVKLPVGPNESVGFLGIVRYFQNEAGRPYVEHFGAETPVDSGNPLLGVFGFVPQPVLVDIDADGDFDSFLGGGKGHIAYFQNTGTATSPGFFDDGLGVTFADVDGDGDLDAFAGGTYMYFAYEGQYAYTIPVNVVIFYENLGTAAQPFWKLRPNPAFKQKSGRKGFSRLSAAPPPGRTAKARSPIQATPAGNFAFNPLPAYGFAPTFGDLDGDGDLDAMVGDKSGDIGYFANSGTTGAPIFTGYSPRPDATTTDFGGWTKPFLADVDGDGDLDLLVGVNDDIHQLRYFENTDKDATAGTTAALDGDGSFVEQLGSPANPFYNIDVTSTYSSGSSTSASPWLVDWDGDGDLDLFVGDKYQVHLYPNSGNATTPSFGAEDVAGNPLGAYIGTQPTPAIVDINADGLWDAYLGGFGSNELLLGQQPGVTVTPLAIVTTEAGGQGAFTVVLDTQPDSTVVIDVASNDVTEGVPDKTQLTFTPADWDQPQTVTVTGQPDALPDGDVAYTILLTMDGVTVGAYAAVDPTDVAAVNLDVGNWPAQKTVSGSLQTGGAITYTVTLHNPTSVSAPDAVAEDEFTDVLPAQLALVSASATSGTAVATVGTNTVTWNGSLAAGASVTITIQATVLAPNATVVSNQGTFRLDLDGNGSDETAFLTDFPTTPPPAQPDPTVFTVGAAVIPMVSIPTLSQVGATLLALLMAGLGVLGIRRR